MVFFAFKGLTHWCLRNVFLQNGEQFRLPVIVKNATKFFTYDKENKFVVNRKLWQIKNGNYFNLDDNSKRNQKFESLQFSFNLDVI